MSFYPFGFGCPLVAVLLIFFVVFFFRDVCFTSLTFSMVTLSNSTSGPHVTHRLFFLSWFLFVTLNDNKPQPFRGKIQTLCTGKFGQVFVGFRMVKEKQRAVYYTDSSDVIAITATTTTTLLSVKSKWNRPWIYSPRRRSRSCGTWNRMRFRTLSD